MNQICFSQVCEVNGKTAQSQPILPMLNRTISDEFYHSDISLDLSNSRCPVEFRAATAGPIRITTYSSAGTTTVSRKLQHIRDDRHDFYVFWFVTKGRFRIQQGIGNVVIGPSHFAITHSARPATFRAEPGEEGIHDSVQVLVPSYFIMSVAPQLTKMCGQRFPLAPGAGQMSLNILRVLFSEAEAAPSKIITEIAAKIIEALASVAGGGEFKHQSVKDERRKRIFEYIEFHLDEPNLSATRIAAANGISTRYLHRLLAEVKTSLRDQIWVRRLVRASQLLGDANYKHMGITEIAYFVGFASPAHFSRSYRRLFGISPREARQAMSSRETQHTRPFEIDPLFDKQAALH